MNPLVRLGNYIIGLSPVRRRFINEHKIIKNIFNSLDPYNKKLLIAGPFIGEFGWEVAEWQGYVRHLSKFYAETIVISRPENEYLYRDFVKKFIPHDPCSYETEFYSCRNAHEFNYQDFLGGDILHPVIVGPDISKYLLQEYRVFGRTDAVVPYFDVVIHGRDIPAVGGLVTKAGRNWPAEKWNILCDLMAKNCLSIAAIGVPSLSICPAGVTDLRSSGLELQSQVLHRCGVCIGPSSGAMHLASHCATPLVVWTDRIIGELFGGSPHRYMFSWNPHRSDVTVLIEDTWSPSPTLVLKYVMEMLAAKAQGQRVHQIVDLGKCT